MSPCQTRVVTGQLQNLPPPAGELQVNTVTCDITSRKAVCVNTTVAVFIVDSDSVYGPGDKVCSRQQVMCRVRVIALMCWSVGDNYRCESGISQVCEQNF